MSHPAIRRGQIWLVDWSPGRGSEQLGKRPALIIQTDAANTNPRYPNTIVLTLSTKGRLLTHWGTLSAADLKRVEAATKTALALA